MLEAIRFNFVREFILSHYEEGESPCELIRDVTLNWSNMSSYIIDLVMKYKSDSVVHFGTRKLTNEEIL